MNMDIEDFISANRDALPEGSVSDDALRFMHGLGRERPFADNWWEQAYNLNHINELKPWSVRAKIWIKKVFGSDVESVRKR